MKLTMRKLLALALCLALCLCAVPAALAGNGSEAEAQWPAPPASSGGGFTPLDRGSLFANAKGAYNAAAAATYALKWWNSFNMEWYNWEAEGYGDCTNFVSQCLYAGGMSMTPSWYWISRDNYVGSWTIPHKLAEYLASQGYKFVLFPTANQVSKGDVLFYDWDLDGTFDHSAICVGSSGGACYICAHSAPHCTADWTLGAERYMVIQLNGSDGTVYPGKPVLTGMSSTYEAGKAITFTWSATANTTYYKLLLGRKNASGAYELVEQYQNVTSGFKLTLQTGDYAVILKSYNGNSMLPDGSDYASTAADTVYFSVRQPDFTVAYNANGGMGAPAAQAKTPGVALTLSAAIPTRQGYFFLGWAESPDAAAAYLPGGSFTKDLSVTLYAVWTQPDLILPEALSTVGEEAFMGCAFRFAKLSETTESIGHLAFSNCPNLKYVFIPRACTMIDATAFDGVSGLTVFGARGSFAENFARLRGYGFLPVS